jgi:hypothetical protein
MCKTGFVVRLVRSAAEGRILAFGKRCRDIDHGDHGSFQTRRFGVYGELGEIVQL